METKQRRVGIVGAGPAGLLSIKCCLDEGLLPVCFEQHDQAGGTFHYTEHERKNQTASTYKNMHLNDSKDRMAYSDFRALDHHPHYPTANQYHEYLVAYAEHFRLLRHIHFNHSVTRVKKAEDYSTSGRWEVLVKAEDGNGEEEKHVFDAVALCSGNLSHGRIPDLPGMDIFKGKLIHSTQYRRPETFAEQEVIVMGSRFSASDQACDLVRQAKGVYLSVKGGMHVAPLTIKGRCSSLATQRRHYMTSMAGCGEPLMAAAAANLNHAQFGLQTDRHAFIDGNFTRSDELGPCLLKGKVKIVPRVMGFTEDSVIYSDDTTQKVDAVIMATGYYADFKYVDCPDIQENHSSKFLLYKGVFPLSCTHPSLAVFSSSTVIGSYAVITELAARWATRVFAGKCHLPSKEKMHKFTMKRRDYLVNKCGGKLQIPEFVMNEELAGELGVRPDLHRLLLRDPLLAYKVYCGPVMSFHYRLVGPGAQQAAWQYTHHFYDQMYPNDVTDKLKYLALGSMLLVVLAAVIYTAFTS